MKKTIFVAVIILTSLVVRAQNKTIKGSFILKNLVDQSKLEFYTQAIENANFEDLRLNEKTQVFEFENGFSLELASATELIKKGIVIDLNNYKQELDKDFQTPLFRISNEGHLVALYNSIPTKNQLKTNSTK